MRLLLPDYAEEKVKAEREAEKTAQIDLLLV
jgi:hypothetical protein